MQSLRTRVLHTLHRATAWPQGERLLLAVSGGCDSMVLLHVIYPLAAEQGWRLKVAHFNHHLRGRPSDLDEALVRRACTQLDLTCVVGHGDVAGQARKQGVSIEMAARELRHRFLARAARQGRCRWVLTAHHADDQAELVLLRLLRGTGAEGLSGMAECDPSPADARIHLVRPLLAIPREALCAYARREGIAFREDASNRSPDHLRNRVRQELLPLLRRRYQPAVSRLLCRLAEVLRAEDHLLNAHAEAWWQRKRPTFPRLPLALRRRVLRVQARRLGLPLDFEAVERLLSAPGETVNVAGNRLVRCTREGELTLVSPQPVGFRKETRVVLLDVPNGRVNFGGLTIAFRTAAVQAMRRPRPTPGREQFDADAVGRRILLRHWRAGDRFTPIGMKAAVKLQDLFTHLKVPAAERRRRVVAEAECGELFWVEGLRISEGFKWTPATRRKLGWEWNRA